MKRLLVGFTCFLLILLVTRETIGSENNDKNPYNEENFLPLKSEEGEIIYGQVPCISDNKIAYWYSNYYSNNKAEGIWMMNHDGTERTLLYSTQFQNVSHSISNPKFNSGGNKIIYSTQYSSNEYGKGESSINLLTKNGSKWNTDSIREELYRTNKTTGEVDQPNFNLDGNKIVYSLSGGIAWNSDIFVMNVEGDNHVRLTTSEGSDTSPSYNHDSSKIAWIHSSSNSTFDGIWIMNSDGKNKKCITPDKWEYSHPSFTSDGKILFVSNRLSPHSNSENNGNIWMMDDDGTNQTLIVPRVFRDSNWNIDPAISPDNTIIVFRQGYGYGSRGLYYVKDQNGTWTDFDRDGVADVCDGAPINPLKGYIKGNVSNDYWEEDSDSSEICVDGIFTSVILISSLAIVFKKKSR